MRKPSPAKLADVVRRHLSDDLRRAPYKGNPNPMAGHCYVASEALYHMLGGKQSPWVPQYVHHEGSPHWFLKHRGTGEVLDATSEQFKTPVPYHASVGKGFLTREPSARARTVIQAVQAALPGQLTKAERDQKQVASIAAFNKDGMLLFGRRNDNGKWTLPGGHFEPGEDKNKAAVRELYEETGLTPVGMRYLGAKPGGRSGEVMVHAFAASVKGDVNFQNDPDQEFAEAQWVNPQAIPSGIMDNLHNPKNVTLQLLGIQEDLVKAEGDAPKDAPKPPEPVQPEIQPPPEHEVQEALSNAHNVEGAKGIRELVQHPHVPTAHRVLDAVVNRLEADPDRHYMLIRSVNVSPHATEEHVIRAHNAIQKTRSKNEIISDAQKIPLSLQHSIVQSGNHFQIGELLRRPDGVHPEVLKGLLRSPGLDGTNALRVASNPTLDEEGVRLAYENPALRREVLKRPDVPDDIRKLGIEHGHAHAIFHDTSRGVSNDVIEHAINHSKESRDALAGWYGHDDGKNSKMTEDQTRRFLLLADGEQLRNFGNASRPHLQQHFSKPENIEHFLVNMKDDMYRPLTGPAQLRTRLEENPELAHKLLFGESSKHPNREHVAKLLSGTDSKFLLDKMLKDHDPEVVDTVLHSHHLTPEQLEPFVNKPQHFLSLSRNPNLTKERFDRTMDSLFNADDKESKGLRDVLPVVLGHGDLHRLHDLNRDLAEMAPELRDDHLRHWYRSNPDMALSHRMSPEHLDKLIQPSIGERKWRPLLNHPHLSDKTLARVVESPEFKLNHTSRAFAAVIHHPNVSEQTLQKILQLPHYDDYDKGMVRHMLGEKNPDHLFDKKVAVKLGTSKLRQIRDAILDSKRPFAHKKEFADKGVDLTPFTIPGTANVSVEKIQQHIDNLQPHATYNVSEDVWDGAQRHSNEHSKVFQLNLTKDLINKMKEEGVYDTFKEMHEASRSSGHPVHEKHGLGWVRYTQGSKPTSDFRDDWGKTKPEDNHFFIDEIQSDFGQDFARNILTNTVNHYRNEGEDQGLEGDELEEYVREREEEAAKEVRNRYPQEHVEKINNILFGGKYANEILAEAFLQHLRDKGHAGSDIRIHHAHTKAPLSHLRVRDDGTPHQKWIDTKNGNKSVWQEADKGIPDEAQQKAFLAAGIKPVDDIPRVHAETYGTMPKKVLGFAPTSYGELATENNPELKGKKTWGGKLLKREEDLAKSEFLQHYNLEDEPALHQPEDEIDHQLKAAEAHSTANKNTEYRLALKHPGMTEDHLIRSAYRIRNKDGWVEVGDLSDEMLQHPEAKHRLQAFLFAHSLVPHKTNDKDYNAILDLTRYASSPEILDEIVKLSDEVSVENPLFQNRHFTDQQRINALKRPDFWAGLHRDQVGAMAPDVLDAHVRAFLKSKTADDYLPGVGDNPNLKPETIDLILKKRPGAIGEIAAHPNFTVEHAIKGTQNELSWDAAQSLASRKEFAKHPEIAKNMLDANKQDFRVIAQAIDNGVGTPEDLMRVVTGSTDQNTEHVTRALARPDATLEHFNALKSNPNFNLSTAKLGSFARSFLASERSPDDFLNVFPLVPSSFKRTVLDENAAKLGPEHWKQVLDVFNLGDDSDGAEYVWSNGNLSKEMQMELLDKHAAEHAGGNSDGPARAQVSELARNENVHPEVLNRIIESPLNRNPVVARRIMANPRASEQHHRKMLESGWTQDSDILYDFLRRTPNVDLVRAALNSPNVNHQDYDAAMDNERIQLPDDVLFSALDAAKDAGEDGKYLVNKAIMRLSESHHPTLATHPHPYVRESVARRTNNPELLRQLAKDGDSEVSLSAIKNLHAPMDMLEGALQKPGLPADVRKSVAGRLILMKPDGQHKEVVHAKFGTNKARKLRDLILAQDKLEMRHKDLGNIAQGVKYGVNPKNGNLSVEELQKYIDSQPATRYNVSHGKWDGVQRHNDENSKVFQLNLTDEHVRQMQQAGVYGTFLKLQENFMGSHPLRDHSIGWVRYTGKTRGKGKGIFIDEVQSDHAVPLAEKARTEAYRNKMSSMKRTWTRQFGDSMPDELVDRNADYWDLYGVNNAPIPEHLSPESKAWIQKTKDGYARSHQAATQEAQERAEAVNQNYPAEHQKTINKILFGGKHSAEVLMEAFHQHLRDKGHIRLPVAIHTVHTKATDNLGIKPDENGKVDLKKVPGHYQKAYRQVPEDTMQMEPATYSADNMATQDSPDLQGKETYQHPVRKALE